MTWIITNGVVSHSEPDILECEVKCLGSTAVHKASGCNGIPVEYLKPSKMMLSKCCIQYASKSGRPSSGYRTGKGQSSSLSPRRAVLKKVQTTRRLLSSPMLVGSCSKSCILGSALHEPRNSRHPSWV